MRNPQLLSLREDIAVAEARLVDLFSRIDTGESGALWAALREASDSFEVAQATSDLPAMQRHWATMRQLVQQGSDDHAAWAEIYRVWDSRTKLTQQETRTLVSMQQMVTAQELAVMFGVITDAINRSVTAHAPADIGRRILASISSEFAYIAEKEAQAACPH
jgi:hypothetical protein